MWIYQQSSGKLFDPKGVNVATGYSGHGEGFNQPNLQDRLDVLPLPQGIWYMGKAYDHPTHGPCTIPLTPEPGTETFGRTGFLCHGDRKDAPGKHLASLGCMIMPHPIREA